MKNLTVKGTQNMKGLIEERERLQEEIRKCREDDLKRESHLKNKAMTKAVKIEIANAIESAWFYNVKWVPLVEQILHHHDLMWDHVNDRQINQIAVQVLGALNEEFPRSAVRGGEVDIYAPNSPVQYRM